jgi:hypothetical protein
MHRKQITLAILLLFCAALLLLAGCKDTELGPIFYTLENEEPIIDLGLANEITVSHVVTAGGSYYAAAAKIYVRSTGGGDWSELAIPDGSMCTTLAYNSGETALYAGFVNRSNGSGMGLWKKTLPAGAWTQLADFSTGAEVTTLKVADNQLFVATLESRLGKLYSYSSVGAFQGLSDLPDAVGEPFSYEQVFVRDIAYDGAFYWLAAGSNLFSSAAAGGPFTVAGVGEPSGVEFRGVHYSDGVGAKPPSGLYVSVYDVSEADGRIYHYDGAWTGSGTVSTAFSEFLSADTNRLWVGTLDGGYYDLQGTTAAELFASIADRREPENTISDLYNGAVLRFTLDGTTIFACTSLAGLWRTGNLGVDWSRE